MDRKVICVSMNIEMVTPPGVETAEDIKAFIATVFQLRQVNGRTDFESVHRMNQIEAVMEEIGRVDDFADDWWVDFYPSVIKVWDVDVDLEGAGAIDWGEQIIDTTERGTLDGLTITRKQGG